MNPALSFKKTPQALGSAKALSERRFVVLAQSAGRLYSWTAVKTDYCTATPCDKGSPLTEKLLGKVQQQQSGAGVDLLHNV